MERDEQRKGEIVKVAKVIHRKNPSPNVSDLQNNSCDASKGCTLCPACTISTVCLHCTPVGLLCLTTQHNCSLGWEHILGQIILRKFVTDKLITQHLFTSRGEALAGNKEWGRGSLGI